MLRKIGVNPSNWGFELVLEDISETSRMGENENHGHFCQHVQSIVNQFYSEQDGHGKISDNCSFPDVDRNHRLWSHDDHVIWKIYRLNFEHGIVRNYALLTTWAVTRFRVEWRPCWRFLCENATSLSAVNYRSYVDGAKRSDHRELTRCRPRIASLSRTGRTTREASSEGNSAVVPDRQIRSHLKLLEVSLRLITWEIST